MYQTNLYFYICLALLCVFVASPTQCQPALLNDKSAQQSFKKSLDFNYNMEFKESEKVLETLRPAYNQHPAWLVAQALRLGALHYPFVEHTPEHLQYQANLEQCVKKGEQIIRKKLNPTEATFFIMLAYGLLARNAGDFGHSLSAVNYARKAYPFMKQGFELKKQYAEFYFTTGLYNYYRVKYPQIYPLYQPFTSFFPTGNKTIGMADMEIATHKSTFSAVEAHHFLSLIYLRFEEQTEKGLVHAEYLYHQFPKNLLFRAIYAECLVQKQLYNSALEHAKVLNASPNPLYHVAGWTFAGLAAQHDGQDQKARICFQNAIEIANKQGKAAKHWQGTAHASMARLALAAKPADPKKARYHYQRAYQNCQSSQIRKEAEIYLEK